MTYKHGEEAKEGADFAFLISPHAASFPDEPGYGAVGRLGRDCSINMLN